MSADSLPISPSAFAAALKDLTIPSLYAKTSELRNSIAHLERSNNELKEYIATVTGGDKICEEAVGENEEVIKRMLGRVDMIKAEVEARGQEWIDLDGADIPNEPIRSGASATESADAADAPAAQGNPTPQDPVSDPPVESNRVSHQSPMPHHAVNGDRPQDDDAEGVYL